jgi:hypothetical protein
MFRKPRALLIWAASGILAASPAFACKGALVARDQVIAATAVVFDGEVLRVELDATGEREVVTLRVHGAIKGLSARAAYRLDTAIRRRPEKTVTVISRVSDAACGWDFREGPQRLTVGAERDRFGALVATRCTMYNLNR